MKILMVCLGNICRSPLAEGIMAQKIKAAGLPWSVDSAGTGHWHIGKKPDPRSVATARAHGLDISTQRARQFAADDLDRFDLILTMDASNLQNVLALASTPAQRHKVRPILDFAHPGAGREVPDPYYDDDGFEHVYRLLNEACDRVLAAHQ